MKRFITVITLVFLTLGVFSLTLDDVMKVMDEYFKARVERYDQIPMSNVFQAKVLIKKFRKSLERAELSAYFNPLVPKRKEDLLNQLEDIEKLLKGKELVFENFRYNEKSLEYFRLVVSLISADKEEIKRLVEFAFNKSSDKEELFTWVWTVMKKWPWEAGIMDSDVRPIFDRALKAFLILSEYFLKNSPDIIENLEVGNNYYVPRKSIVIGVVPAKSVLEILKKASSHSSQLSRDEKELILSFVVEGFQDYDEAVEIYCNLSPDGC